MGLLNQKRCGDWMTLSWCWMRLRLSLRIWKSTRRNRNYSRVRGSTRTKTTTEQASFSPNRHSRWFSRKYRKSKTTSVSNRYHNYITGRKETKTLLEGVGRVQKCHERSNDDHLPRLPRNRRVWTSQGNSRGILRCSHQIRIVRSIFTIFQYLQEETSLWWASKELLRGKILSDYTGKNEKTKIVKVY